MRERFAVIIAGSRSFTDYALLCEKCDYFFSLVKPTSILCGEARGADALGKRYAVEHGIRVESFPANWEKFGKSAGYIRNGEMLRHADALVAFWDGKSPGTKHMIDNARRVGIPCRVVSLSTTMSNEGVIDGKS